jgi:serine/threonine protein kinase/tetratricopeptide (TPR) repeat protein
MPDQTLEFLSADVPISADATLPPLSPDDGTNFLEGQAIGLPEVPGYEIISELGRGGMGVVYKARQKGLGRIVALKMVLAGAHAGASQLARFQAEAEAIARIQHPHIVQIYEVNTVDVGSGTACPYMALEFVSGGGLETYLNGKPLLPRQAAAMVQALADAMQQAHEKGVVHRDLKPGNVLLALHATAPTPAAFVSSAHHSIRQAAVLELTVDGATLEVIPKITDFGLAKQMESKTGQTVSGAVLGTPAYMAPEQAEGQSKEVGPAADIYALGVILYEMLTGRVPFQGTTVMETIIQVMNSEPVPPADLQPTVPKDLDTICLKCLAKEAIRRYASAAALAADLRRFLTDEPIQARPVSSIEKTRRWCRRNPRIALLLAALAVTFFGGFAAVTLMWRQAETLRDQAETQRALTQVQRDRAERNYERARRTVHRFHQEVTENPLLREPGTEPARNKLLESVREFYEEFSAERIDDERLLEELARTLARLAQMRSEVDPNKQSAIDVAQRGVAMWEGLVQKHPEKPEFLGELVHTQWLLGRLHRLKGDRTAAVAAYEKALALSRQLNAAQPGVPKYQADMARCLRGLAHAASEAKAWTESESLYRQALNILEPLAEKHPEVMEHRRDLAATYTGLGTLTGDKAQLDRAVEACHKAAALQQQLVLENPDSAQYGSDLARSHFNLGQAWNKAKRWLEASHAFENARQAYETLHRNHPAFPDFQRELVRSSLQLAELHLRADQPGLARERVQQALDLLARFPAMPDAARQRGHGQYLMARIEAGHDPERALQLLAQAKKEGHFKDKKNQEALAQEEEFAPLRTRPEFKALTEEVK